MAKKTSCIRHRAEDICVILRADYLELLDGNACAASVLAVLEYWTNWKIDHPQYIQKTMDDEDAVWIYKTMADLVTKDLLNSFGEYAVRQALKTLEQRGYLRSWRGRFGGAKEYSINTPQIQADIDALNAQTRPRNRGSTPRNRGSTPRNRGTSPRNRGTSPRNRGTSPRNRGHTESTPESTQQIQRAEITATTTTETETGRERRREENPFSEPAVAVAVPVRDTFLCTTSPEDQEPEQVRGTETGPRKGESTPPQDAHRAAVRQLLRAHGITRNRATAFLYDNPPPAARVRAAIAAAQRIEGLRNPIGQAIRWLKDGTELPPAPCTLGELAQQLLADYNITRDAETEMIFTTAPQFAYERIRDILHAAQDDHDTYAEIRAACRAGLIEFFSKE